MGSNCSISWSLHIICFSNWSLWPIMLLCILPTSGQNPQMHFYHEYARVVVFDMIFLCPYFSRVLVACIKTFRSSSNVMCDKKRRLFAISSSS